MSDVEISEGRDPKGRFLQGNTGNVGGRPKGARSKLTTAFLEDLRDCWETHGASVLERVARDDPAALLRTVAMLMPKTIDINATINVEEFASRYKTALELLGNEPEPPRPRKTLRIINHADRSR
jgi:hypothetical protein